MIHGTLLIYFAGSKKKKNKKKKKKKERKRKIFRSHYVMYIEVSAHWGDLQNQAGYTNAL